MHCEECKDLLLDLAYGELDEARSSEVHAHLRECSSCSEDWAKLSNGRAAAAMLPVAVAPAPSRALQDAIDKALPKAGADRSGPRALKSADVSGSTKTAEKAETTDVPASAGASSNVVPLKGGARWIERLAAMAMRREVAMAAVFLMALGVGVTTLYNPSRNPAITEEERSRDVIPAVEVSAENRAADDRSGQRRAGAVDPASRGRAAERPDTARAGRALAPTSAAASTPSPSPAGPVAPTAIATGNRRNESASDNPASAQAVWQQQNANAVAAQPAQSPMPAIGSMQRAMSNAGVEVAGVQQQASSPIELAARSALERGDVDGALQQYRRALASAGDDVTRARLQRQIDSLEASQAAQAAAAAQNTQNTQAGSVPITQVQAASESSLRRSRAAPARATNRTRSSTAGSADNYGSLAY